MVLSVSLGDKQFDCSIASSLAFEQLCVVVERYDRMESDHGYDPALDVLSVEWPYQTIMFKCITYLSKQS
jgi:hypothetical protein